MIEVRCFDSVAEAEFLRQEIDALNLACARPDPFSTFEFLENFVRHGECDNKDQDRCLWFLTAFLENRLVGYLVLEQSTQRVLGMRIAKLGFCIAHDTDRPHLVARAEHLGRVSEAFYEYLLGRKQEWSFLEFQQQDDTSMLFPPPATVDMKGYLLRQWPSLDNGTLHLRWGSLHDYFQALSGSFRSNVSRQMRSLLAAGDVELLTSSDPAVTPVLFELYRGIEAQSWKSRAHADIGRHPERIEYINGLLDATQPMQVSIQLLLLDGRPIAGLINGAFMQGLYALHMAYDDRLSRLAPGSAAMLMGVRQAIDGHCAFYNLLSGSGYYKVRWLAQITATRTAQIYRTGGVSYWRRVLGDCKRRVFAAGSKQTSLFFNPTRRSVSEPAGEPMEPGQIPALQMSPVERERIDALITEVRKGQGEFLSAAELAAAMPFETKRAPAMKGPGVARVSARDPLS